MAPIDGEEGADGLLSSLSDRLATPQEAQLVKELRHELRDDLAAAPSFPELVGDIRLLRTLRGFDHSVEDAARGFRAHLEMRQLHGLDAARERILKEWGGRLWELRCEDLPHGRLVCSYMPEVMLFARGRDGDPVSLGIWGQGRPSVYVREVDDWRRKFTEYFVHMNEAKAVLLDQASREQGRLVHFLCVFDLENWNMVANTERSWTAFCTEVTGRIGETYHDFNRRFVAIRSTRWARTAYGMIRPMLPKKVTEKVWLFGDDFLKSRDFGRMLDDRTGARLQERSYSSARRHHEGRVTIRPRSDFQLEVELPRGFTLQWEFDVEGDRFREQCLVPFLPCRPSEELGFSLSRRPDAAAEPEDAPCTHDRKAQRVQGAGTCGKYTCAEDACGLGSPGMMVLHWDNSHALLTPKTLRYRVSVEGPVPKHDASDVSGPKAGGLLTRSLLSWAAVALAVGLGAVGAGFTPAGDAGGLL